MSATATALVVAGVWLAWPRTMTEPAASQSPEPQRIASRTTPGAAEPTTAAPTVLGPRTPQDPEPPRSRSSPVLEPPADPYTQSIDAYDTGHPWPIGEADVIAAVQQASGDIQDCLDDPEAPLWLDITIPLDAGRAERVLVDGAGSRVSTDCVREVIRRLPFDTLPVSEGTRASITVSMDLLPRVDSAS